MVGQTEITLPELSRGFHLINSFIEKHLPDLPEKGLLNIFLHHTSAALAINENADPTVRADFESFFSKLVPEYDPVYKHVIEGPDDMPAHLKSSILGQSISIPIKGGKLHMGLWQGIYLCEFRDRPHRRKITLTVLS